MLQVFGDAGFELSRELAAGEIEVTFPIAPTAAYEAAVEERDHVAVVASLRPFFEPRSVAVIGASRRRETIGGVLFRNILEGEFAGAAYPVNRGGEPVAGVARVPLRRRDRTADRPRRPLRAGRGRLPSGRGGARRRRARALRHLGRVRRGRERGRRSGRTGCSRSCARTARA